MNKQKIKSLPEYASVIRRNGKFLRMKSDNALAGSGQLFEQEITMDSVGQSCTAFRINEFTYDHEANVLTLSAMISFPEKCKRITLQADLLDEETEQVIASLEEHTVEDAAESVYQYQGDPVNGVPAVNTAFVILYACWIDSTNAQGEAAILEDELQFGVIYKHEYPQKEKNGYVTFGEGASSQAMELAKKNRELEGREESENIVIALYREPTDTKDLDYLCKFGKIDVDQDGKKKSYPPVSVPAKGVMFLEDGNTEFIYDAENPVKAACTITSYNGSGAFVAAVGVCDGSSYKTQDGEIKIKVTPTSLQYEMTTAWKEPFLDSGLWDIHNFNYDLSITCTIRVDKRMDRFTYRVSSIVPQGGFCMEKIPRLTIKWGCLAEGTEILMADGTQKKVQDLLIGDLIKTVSGSARVKNMWLGTEEGCVRIAADNGRELVITRSHPVLTERGWKKAEDLTCADVIKMENACAAICAIEHIAEAIKVFNPETGGKPVYANGFVAGDFTLQNS